ncbi:unnamed protein product (macronuclear) [Paramecium tetraurelia]|uniref:PHD-type domain-containing protein n=1 Tax=Paramecium tetraurelia TaxID=5888 RepID=A0D890_PARTE|nr:uncharacterized protein GSPATT00014224001 [Paramecium tetraurelia]CAK79257.1 unnamed protein product [Paramecium tetraurelia]|eukprot:XP_001446654.1 hypothetical protein (macronuclear) [Paramecium tetraurelia strain d4-2]
MKEDDSAIQQNKIDELIKEQKYSALIQLISRKDPQRLKQYSCIKIKNQIFRLKQDVAVCANNNDIYYGKLIKIYCIKDVNDQHVPVIQVQWYYTKQDLNLDKKSMRSISIKELFFSTHVEFLAANKLQCPIEVMTFDQYTQLEYGEETKFFSRAAIDLKTMEPMPRVSEWQKSCVCRMPQNPDIQVIQCETCDEWFHLDCVNLKSEEAEQIENYKCPGCQ